MHDLNSDENNSDESMMIDDPIIDVPSPLWYEEYPFTPELDESREMLDFKLLPGRSAEGATVAAIGRYRVGNAIIGRYGGQMPGPIRAVAVRSVDGAVVSRECIDDRMDGIVLLEAKSGEPELGMHQSACVDIDLPAHLMLPPEAAIWHVFLWIDHLVSPVRLAHVPHNLERRTPGLPTDERPASIVKLGALALIPQGAAAELELTVAAGEKSQVVRGSWSSRTVWDADAAAPRRITLLASGQRDRRFGWTTVDAGAAEAGVFQVDPRELLGAPSVPQTILVVALAGGALSNVAVCTSEG